MHFVLSAPRSGSTWLARALNHHPEIFATEHRLFGNFCEIWPNNDGSTSPRITFDAYADAFAMHYMFAEQGLNRKEFIDSFQQSFVRFLIDFAKSRTNKSVVVDKVTPYLGTSPHVLRQIRRLLPDAKVILLMRDGRDVLTSGTFDWIQREPVDSPRYQYFVAGNESNPPQRFFDDQLIHQWAEHWREVAETASNFEMCQTIGYEAMKENHAGELSKVFETLGVESNDLIAAQCASATTFEKTTGRAAGDQRQKAKARKGVSGDWKNFFTRQDGELFHQIAGDEMKQYGYEASSGWLDELPDVWSPSGEIRR